MRRRRSSGSTREGTRYEGQAAVRAAFQDVMDQIKGVPTKTKIATVQGGQKAPFKDVPEEEVVIKSVRRAPSDKE